MVRGDIIARMVPKIVRRLKVHFDAAVARVAILRADWWQHRRLLGWLLAVWALAICLPAALLWPEHGTDRPALWILAGLAPLGALVGAGMRQPWLAVAAALAGCVPPLVGCPALWREPATRPWTALLLAAALLGAQDAALRTELARTSVQPPAGLRAWLRWPTAPRLRILAVMGPLWLTLGWWGLPGHVIADEASRSVRVAAVAACWSLLTWPPQLARPAPQRPVAGHLLRRGAWLLILGLMLWLWRR